LENDVNLESIDQFLKSFIDGTLKPNMKSEEIPDAESQINVDVKTIVYNNFQDIVIRQKNSVVVLFYRSPQSNCEICKEVVETFQNLALDFRKNNSFNSAHLDFIFGKIDLDKNDIPRHSSKIKELKAIFLIGYFFFFFFGNENKN
jgi:hypothetical protein